MKAALCLAATLLCGVGCGSGEAQSAGREAIVYGEDGRRQYYELSSAAQRDLVRKSALALVSRDVAAQLVAAGASDVKTWGEVAGLCADEPFASEPAAAFCSGVLVGRDLVLTSEHCVSALPLSDWLVVFDYYFTDEGMLQVDASDVFAPKRLVALEVRDDSAADQLDFAFIQLSHEAAPEREPALVYTRPPPLRVGDQIYSISAGGGVPLKWDASGSVVELREQDDYFLADTDTSQGSSGSGVFDEGLGLLGVLGQGSADLETTAAGCATMRHASQGNERITLGHRAIAELCRVEPELALCNEACPQPCRAQRESQNDSGCALTGRPRASGWSGIGLLFAAAFARLSFRSARSVSRRDRRPCKRSPRT